MNDENIFRKISSWQTRLGWALGSPQLERSRPTSTDLSTVNCIMMKARLLTFRMRGAERYILTFSSLPFTLVASILLSSPSSLFVVLSSG